MSDRIYQLKGDSDRTPPKHLKKRSPSPILQASPSTIPDKQKAMLLG